MTVPPPYNTDDLWDAVLTGLWLGWLTGLAAAALMIGLAYFGVEWWRWA